MGIRITANDITIEVGTLDEARSILSTLWALQGKPKSTSIIEESKKPQSPYKPIIRTEPTMSTKMAEFYRSLLSIHTRSMLKALFDNPDGLTSEELIKIINLESGNAFGGALSGIAKAAKPYLLSAEDIYYKPKEGESHYRLTPSMRDVIQSEERSRAQ